MISLSTKLWQLLPLRVMCRVRRPHHRICISLERVDQHCALACSALTHLDRLPLRLLWLPLAPHQPPQLLHEWQFLREAARDWVDGPA